ncbi:MAG: transketolase [Fusobacteriaceae bacterium]|jgi:transketolase|nr:transketolase [Fusobacteriaceae bacterium]
MSLTFDKKEKLEAQCLQFRKSLIEILHRIQTGHPGGSLSVCEILVTLYFDAANISPANINDRDRDKIVLCKGHAAPMLYLCLAEKGFFPKEELNTLRQIDSRLQGHPCSKDTPGVEVSTGPLGAGYPVALGMAISDAADGVNAYTYAILGDGEINEGVVWETCQNASKFKADRLITILDWNKVQLDGTAEEIMPQRDIPGKFKAFGYNTIACDGHNIASISAAINLAKSCKGMPSIILANTVKGKGVSFMEGKSAWHGKAISDEDYRIAMKELGGVS